MMQTKLSFADAAKFPADHQQMDDSDMAHLLEEARATLEEDEEEFRQVDLQVREEELSETHKPSCSSDICLSYI